MNRFRIVHVTEFEYESLVSESYNEVHLQPRDDERQSCLSFRLVTRPAATASASLDYFENWVHRFAILRQHRHLRIEAESVVMVHPPPPAPVGGPTLAELDADVAELRDEHYDFVTPTEYVPALASLRSLVATGEAECDGTALGFARAAAALVNARFRYEKGATHVHSSLADVLAAGAGVCQDFAHVLLGVARARGLPARYVSGYRVPAGQTEDVRGGLASHAWVEVFVPRVGWIGLDPTLGGPVDAHHVRLAYGRDYADVAPVRGVHKGHAGQTLSVDVTACPALDDEGCERRQERSTGEDAPPPVTEPLQQQQ